MRKLIFCIMCLLLFCAACAEAPEPFSFRGMSWDMCPDEVEANECIALEEKELEGSAIYCLGGSGAYLSDYEASLFYMFYSRSLYAAMYDMDGEDAYDGLASMMESAYGTARVLEPGTVGSWVESVSGYCPPVKGDELMWHAADGTALILVRYDGGTSFILQAPEDTHGIRQAAMPEKPEWTILIYLCGTDLETGNGCATGNMNTMLESAYSDDVRVVIETGGTREWQNGIDPDTINRYVRSEDGFERAEVLESANMGSVATLNDFISWGVRNYPAEHVGLILWDHGSTSVDGICFDELYDDCALSLTDIALALGNNMKFLPEGFEFIGFDACLMSSLECAVLMAPYARYMYASEELEPGTGWDYTALFNLLCEDPQADGWDLGREQVVSYADFHSGNASTTFSVTDLTEISAVTEAFDAAAREMDELGNDAEMVRGILKSDAFGSNSTTEGYTNMIDISDMMRNLSEYLPSAEAVIDAVESAVVHRVNGTQHAGAGGLSIYYPIRLQGTEDIPAFQEICPSQWYLDFVSRVSKDAVITGETTGIQAAWNSAPDTEAFSLRYAGIDEHGYYVAALESMDELSLASCILYQVADDGTMLYLGEDDNTCRDWENNTVSDAFSGEWAYINGYILPIGLVSANDIVSVYSVPIMFRGKQMNLRLLYDWATGEYSIDGVYASSSRLFSLEEGDSFRILYYYSDGGEYGTMTSGEITVDESLSIGYAALPEGNYAYRIVLYDLAGNSGLLQRVIYHIDSEGVVTIPYEENSELLLYEYEEAG